MNFGTHSQQLCELHVTLLNANRVILVTAGGRRVVVDAPPGSSRDGELSEFQGKFTVKDLGIQARISMGLVGYLYTHLANHENCEPRRVFAYASACRDTMPRCQME